MAQSLSDLDAERKAIEQEENALARRKAKLAEQEAEAEKLRHTALSYIAAFKASYQWLSKNLPDALPKDFVPQQLPKEETFRKKLKLSETEGHNAVEKGRKAIASLG